MRTHFFWALVVLALPLAAAERKFDFNELHENQAPPDFQSTVTGRGKPGDWRVVMDDVTSLMPAISPQAPAVAKRAVLAQLAQDPTDEHFPLLIFSDDTFGDFTLTTRFKTVRGVVEQMAGLAFRIQNETNYYVVRASSLGNTFRFYKVVNGERGTLLGPEAEIPSGVWHELTVECKGNEIRCLLNGKQLIPTITDTSFSKGKIGFWTKSDSVSYFADARIIYTPLELPAQAVVRDMMKKYPRLLNLQVYMAGTNHGITRLVASKDEKETGRPGGKAEQDVIARGVSYYGRDKKSVSVTRPLRDRNGDIIAAVRVKMSSFPGETEESAVVRATPILKEMQGRIQSLQEELQ